MLTNFNQSLTLSGRQLSGFLCCNHECLCLLEFLWWSGIFYSTNCRQWLVYFDYRLEVRVCTATLYNSVTKWQILWQQVFCDTCSLVSQICQSLNVERMSWKHSYHDIESLLLIINTRRQIFTTFPPPTSPILQVNLRQRGWCFCRGEKLHTRTPQTSQPRSNISIQGWGERREKECGWWDQQSWQREPPAPLPEIAQWNPSERSVSAGWRNEEDFSFRKSISCLLRTTYCSFSQAMKNVCLLFEKWTDTVTAHSRAAGRARERVIKLVFGNKTCLG